jgi:hypothetical protein
MAIRCSRPMGIEECHAWKDTLAVTSLTVVLPYLSYGPYSVDCCYTMPKSTIKVIMGIHCGPY